MPIAGFARLVGGKTLEMTGLVASVTGEKMVRLELSADTTDPEGLGVRLAEKLLAAGGREILSEVYGHELE